MTEQPKCNCFDCNLPELESLDYKPTKPSPATEENLTPIIEPKTKVKNSEVVGQPLEQPNSKDGIHVPIFVPNNLIKHLHCPEQPNQNIMLVKTIQSLMTCISNNLGKLPFDSKTGVVIAKALKVIDLFEKTTLYELQKAFE